MEKVYLFQTNPVAFQFDNEIMINATDMAKPFGKRAIDWLKLPSTKEFLATLSEVRKSHFGHNGSVELVKTQKGRTVNATWFHEDVALEFARWLSPAFGIWCNDRIKELFKHGITATPATMESILENPELAIELLTQVKKERERKEFIHNLYSKKENELNEKFKELQIEKSKNINLKIKNNKLATKIDQLIENKNAQLLSLSVFLIRTYFEVTYKNGLHEIKNKQTNEFYTFNQLYDFLKKHSSHLRKRDLKNILISKDFMFQVTKFS